eukprot:TRINITY_DN38581_c0_g1_i1.p1 TRINITY_DN38581_c0_g1~~TRINITY_DN38581_c0_g1_i1.p1  ORF type:complete len:584 (+),score=118.82 TRINITY_DN38581_c0_g1_i1:62-1813(+)
MGARCCTVTPAQDKNGSGSTRRSQITKQLNGMKSYKEFQDLYIIKGAVRPRSSVISVIQRDTERQQVCRKLKMSSMPCQCMADIVMHCQTLSALEHPHLCRFIEVFEDRSYLYLIYERASTTTLFDQIWARSSLTEEEAADYLRQAAMALTVAHSQGIVHGRLSPRSLILANEDDEDDEDCDTQLKICDMGQGFILRPGLFDNEETDKSVEMEQYACSPEYLQKELQCTGEADLPKNAEKNDIWALGTIFFHMLSGTMPFDVTSREELVEQVGRKAVIYDEGAWKKLSPTARDIVEQMLRVNPGLRVSASALLRHQWVKVARTTFPRKRMVELLSNLRINVEESEFKRFVLRVIAEQLPRDGKTEQVIEKAFRCLDKNMDGVLSVQEVIDGLKKHLNLNNKSKEKDLHWLFAQVDRDGSGTVNVQEFMSASMDQKRSTSLPVLWEAFNAFDKDRSGLISPDEIGLMVKEIEGQLVSMEQADSIATEIVRELETMGAAGGLDYEQFVQIMLGPGMSASSNASYYRACWNACGIDCYQVRHAEIERWNITQQKTRANRSVYRRKASRRRSEQPLMDNDPEPDLAG